MTIKNEKIKNSWDSPTCLSFVTQVSPDRAIDTCRCIGRFLNSIHYFFTLAILTCFALFTDAICSSASLSCITLVTFSTASVRLFTDSTCVTCGWVGLFALCVDGTFLTRTLTIPDLEFTSCFVCVCVCVRVCVCACVYVCMYVCMSVCMCVS